MSLIHLNYPLKVDQLLVEAEEARKVAVPHTDDRYGGKYDEWLKSKYTSPLIEQMMRDFDVFGKPRFYFQEPFYEVKEHTDNGTLCSLNFIISDDDVAPIIIEGREYFYRQCLLNTSIPHSVKNGPSERILLKISIFDRTFEDVASSLKFKR